MKRGKNKSSRKASTVKGGSSKSHRQAPGRRPFPDILKVLGLKMPKFRKRYDWKKLVLDMDPEASLGQPATKNQLKLIERSVGVPLPQDIADFLAQVGSVWACAGNCTVWSADKILKQNEVFRSLVDFKELYMPFDHLLLFGDDGCGDMYAYAIDADGRIRRSDVFFWDHENDNRMWEALNLKDFFARKKETYMHTKLLAGD